MLVIAITTLHLRNSGGSEPESLRPSVRLEQIPHLKLENHKGPTSEETAKIERLVESLQDFKSHDLGLLPQWSYRRVFLPVGVFSDLRDREAIAKIESSSQALKRLVCYGPKALPTLLKGLEDRRGTQLVVQAHHRESSATGMMWFDDGLCGNPMNPREQKLLRLGADLWTPGTEPRAQVEAYRVTVADVCFVAIGQIVGRPYEALTGDDPNKPIGIKICSPAFDRKLCSRVQAIWAGTDPEETLFNSLLLNYCTRGMFDGESYDSWALGNEFQLGGAVRLLYYFPNESAPLLAGRLDELDVSEVDDLGKQSLKNGVAANDFVDAVAWSDNPLLRGALTRLAHRAKNKDVVGALRRAGVTVPGASELQK